jgi:peroxiredoxin
MNSQEDGRKWIERVARTYGELSSYQFEGRILSEIAGFKNASKSSSFARYAKPKENKFRYQAGIGDSRCVAACNGVSTIVYWGGSRQYVQKQSADIHAVIRDSLKDEADACLGAALPGTYAALGSQAGSIKVLRHEAINLQSARIDCVVIKMEISSDTALPRMRTERTLWIDPDRLIVLRDVVNSQTLSMKGKTVIYDAHEEVQLSSYRIDEEVDDSVFQFEPPRAAVPADRLNLPESNGGMVVGNSADNLIMRDLNGRRYTFKELRGSILLLDFWATWCAPCIKEMGLLEKIHLRHKDKGLAIFGVNQQQEQLQKDFLRKRSFSFAMLCDLGGTLTRQFKAQELPTMVIIDREGRVVDWEQGLQKQEDLESLLALLGIQ